MSKLRDGLDPVASATGAAPTIDDLRARRARRRNRRIATTSASALGLATVAALVLMIGGGPGNETRVGTAHQGDVAPSVTDRPNAHDDQDSAQHPVASTPATFPPGSASTAASTSIPGVPGTVADQAPTSTTVPALTTPGAPTITSATVGPNLVGNGLFGTDGSDPRGGKGTALVTWTAPASDGGLPITSYWVQAMYTDGGTGPGCRVGPAATSCLVKGLFADEPAVFYVQADNALGAGAASAASTSTVTAPETTPNVPRIANPDIPGPWSAAATAGDASATMTWLNPIYDGGSPITGYLVRSYRSDGAAGPTCNADAAAQSCVVTGLVNGTTYTFRVFAINAIGVGDPSIPSNAVTPGA